MRLTVERATLADVPAIVEMGAAFLEANPVVTASHEGMTRLVEKLLESPDGVIWIGRAGGMAVGMFGAMVYVDPYSLQVGATEVFWWVEPEYRGARSALAWMRTYHAWADERGATFKRMVALDARVGALYTRLGYAPIEVHYQLGGRNVRDDSSLDHRWTGGGRPGRQRQDGEQRSQESGEGPV